MQLTCDWFDGRKSRLVPVIDKNTGAEVGQVNSCFSSGISISLFNGRYTGEVHTYEECCAFLKGAETVLTHLEDCVRCS
jgi:hypothetical protein